MKPFGYTRIIILCKVRRRHSAGIMHPDYLVFIDEGGGKTSQQNDGNAGGEKFIVDKDRCTIKSLLTKTATSWYLDSPLQMESPYAAQLFAHPK